MTLFFGKPSHHPHKITHSSEEIESGNPRCKYKKEGCLKKNPAGHQIEHQWKKTDQSQRVSSCLCNRRKYHWERVCGRQRTFRGTNYFTLFILMHFLFSIFFWKSQGEKFINLSVFMPIFLGQSSKMKAVE